MSNPITITYSCPPNLSVFAERAAAVWNDVLKDLVVVQLHRAQGAANVHIFWSDKVRSAANPTRVAECERMGPDKWEIRFESSIRWRKNSFWDRLLGRGEDTFAAMVHEFGHVFGLPHSADPQDVMHPEIGGEGRLTKQEKAAYRRKFTENNQ